METKPIYGELAKRFQETVHTVIQRKKADKKIQRLKDFLDFISSINGLTMQGKEGTTLLEQVCTKMTESLGYYHAWIALPVANENEVLRIVSSTADRALYAQDCFHVRDLPACVTRAMEQDSLVVVREPSSECPDCPFSFNYAGGAALTRRLVAKDRTMGILSVSAPGAWADDVDEQALLNRLADHLAFTIHNWEKDEQFHRIRGVLDNIPFPMSLISSDYRYLAINTPYAELYGTDRAHILGRTPADLFGQDVFETTLKPYLDRCLAGEDISRQAYLAWPAKGPLWMEMRCFPYRDEQGRISGAIFYGMDISEQKRHEQVLASRLKLSETLAVLSEDALLRKSLDEAELLTDSRVGFFHFLEPDQKTLSLRMWSTNTLERACKAEGKGLHYPIDKAGVWVDCIRQRRPVIHNDYERLAHRKGLPAGHAPVIRMLAVPVLRDEQIVAILGVGNKETDYNQNDVRVVSEFAEMTWDIVLRKRAEMELQKSENGLRKAQRAARLGSWELDLKTNELTWSDEIFRIFEIQPAEFDATLEGFLERVHPDDRQWLKEAYRSSVENKEHYALDHRLLMKDGRIKWVHEECQTYYDDQGEALRSVGTVQDITGQKQAEAKIKSAHHEFLTVLDSLDLTIYVADLETHEILFMNRYMKELFGGDFTGQVCWKAFRHRDRPCEYCFKEQLVDGHNQPTGVHVWEDTHPVTGHQNIYHDRAIKWVDGRLAILQIATDITKLKKMEAKQLEYERRIQQAQKMEAIGTLAGGVAHDFNNILFSLMGYAELLKEDLPPDNACQVYIDEILHAAYRSRDLVKQILSFSRQGENETKPMKLQPVLKEALKLLRASIPTTIEFQQEIDSECDAVNANPTQVHQIVMNLVTNAFHAMEESKGILKVSLKQVELEPELSSFLELVTGPYALLKVTDTGVGIPKEIMAKIFDPYFTTKSKEKGTGLGLSVVQGIVNSCKGDIRIYSEPGKGTEVHVYLPIIQRNGIPSKVQDSLPVTGGTESILLVDDEEAIVRMEQHMLERLGYRVAIFTGSMEAFHAFEASPDAFDLIVTDMTMPNMTGVQLARKIKGIRPAIPVILCTGFSYQIDEEKCRAYGIEGFVMKPVIGSDIAKAIRKALDGALART